MTKQMTPQDIFNQCSELILKSGLKLADIQAILKGLSDATNNIVIGQVENVEPKVIKKKS